MDAVADGAPLTPFRSLKNAPIADDPETNPRKTGRLVTDHAGHEQGDATVFRLFLAVALVAVVARAVHFAGPPLAWTGTADNDDIMRLLSVRGWLAGQGWFDMVQHRMVPPEGLDLHWSRYVDAAIAGLIGLFGAFLPAAQAENLALVAWPALLMGALVALTAVTARRTLGTHAAVFAVLFVLLWPTTGGNFLSYRIDHHNVQILMSTMVVFCLILPGRPHRLGVAGGLAGAVSLAVGLEALVPIGLAGVVLALGAVLRGGAATTRLLAFAGSLCLASVFLFAGQTAPQAWSVPRCDQLSPPFLALTAGAAVASGALAWAGARSPTVAGRTAGFVGASLLVALAAGPLLVPCLKGPYDALPTALQTLIHARIDEAHGLFTAIAKGDEGPVQRFLPVFFATLIAAAALGLRIRRGVAGPVEIRTVGLLLLFAGLGLLGSLSQLRALVWAAPAAPLLTGYGIATLLGAGGADAGPRRALRGLAAVGAMMATLFLPGVSTTFAPAGGGAATASGPSHYAACRSAAALATLSALPQGRVLAPVDYGAPILLFTPHAVVAAPYHRSPDALLNGFVPFEGDEAALRAVVEATKADYLLLCRGETHGPEPSFADGLAAGDAAPSWLRRVDDVHPALIVLRRPAG